MRARTIPLLFILIMLALPAQALTGEAPDGSVDPPGPVVDDGVILWLKAGAFDPLEDPVPGPRYLHRSSTHPYYVVQFDGPVLPAWRDSVEALGVQLLQYLPDHAFFTRVPTTSVDELRQVDHVRYVGPIHPAYRVHPVLFDDLRLPSELRLDLLLWDPGQAASVIASVKAAGGRTVRVDWDVLTVHVRGSAIPGLVATSSLGIRWVEPHLDLEMLNDNDARTVNARQTSDGTYVSTGGALWSYNPTDDSFEGYTGENVTVTVADTGLDTDHPGFAGRIVEYYDYGNDGERDADGHGTHVAGTVLGDGSWHLSDVGQDGKYAGLAPEAKLVVQEVFVAGNPGSNGMGRDAEGAGATISSNSWISGYFGDYNGQCEAYDRLTHDANNVKPGDQPIFYVFGAGNDGSSGVGSIRPPSLAKNVLSVGSTGNGKWGASPNVISGFSSRGPAEDGRIKPDIVLPGHVVASARSNDGSAHAGWSRPPDGQSSYVYGSGTSMATPGAAGSAAVITQYMRDVFEHEPSPALLKAILINGATPLPGYQYPDNNQGWGRIDLERSLLETETYKIYREDQLFPLDMDDGTNEQSYWFLVDSDEDLKVTLTWSDVPGQVSSEKHLINDLDLELEGPDGKKYSGNNFTGGVTDALDDFTHDRVNNVEGILIESPASGLWNLRVVAYNVPTGDQDYALVVSGNVEKGHVDLVPQGMSATPSELEEGHMVTVTAKVANVGNRDATDVRYRFEQEDPTGKVTVVDEASLGPMAATLSVDLGWTVTGVRGTHVLRLIIDPGKGVLESDEDNNVAEVHYFFKGFDVRVTTTKADLTGDPGDLLMFDLSLHNDGNVPDEFSLRMSDPPPGWQGGFVKDSYTVDPDDFTNVLLDIMIPLNATAGEMGTFVVTATSGGNESKMSSVVLTVEVNQVFGLEVAAVSGPQEMLPGEDRTLDLMVRNTGNGLDTFTVSLPNQEELTEGWWVQLVDVSVDVPYRSEHIAQMVLTAPDPALAGVSVEFTVRTSSAGSSLEKSVTFSARVVQFYATDVVVQDLVTSGDVGETVVIPLMITNGGNGPVVYNGDINFPDQSWVGGLDIANLTLSGYKDARVNLSFTVPMDAINRSYDFTMVVISSGGEIHMENFTFSVRQFHDLRLTIISEEPTVTQGQPAWVRLRLENFGNGVESISLTAETPSTWTFEFTERLPVLDPLSEAIIDLRLDTEARTLGGPHEVEVLAYFGPSKTELVQETAVVNILTRPDLLVVDGGLNLSDEHPYVDTLVRITATIRNDGETVARDVFAQLYVDGIPEGQPQYVSSIEPGDEETLTFVWTTNASGFRELRVVADFQDDIDEGEEGNNEASTTVEVSKVDLKTSPGLTHFVAILAMIAAVAITWNQRNRRRDLLH
ncbi:MAG: S8 family serine peptidase [Thermoplasmata archaeon]|nr:MAG: S8 family serine peptidase [Thermoplasmata archaeon]